MIQQSETEDQFQRILIPKIFNDEIIQQFYQVHQLRKQNIKGLQIYCEMIQSENTLEMYEGLVGLRTILSDESENFQSETTFMAVCELNTIKYIIHIIEHNELQLIIFEALWILSNLASGSSQIVDQIIENGSMNCVIQKFSKGNYHDQIIESVCWIFANVTSDSIQNRDLMYKLGTLKILNNYAIERIKLFENLLLIDLLAQSISSYFRFESISPVEDLLVSLKIFQKLIQYDFPPQTQSQICWSFALFAKCHPYQIQVIIDLGIIPRIIELIEVENLEIFYANIYLLTNILQSNQCHQEYLYGVGIIPCLGRLVQEYYQSPKQLKHILKAFEVISLSEHLSIFLLNSDELDLLLSLLSLFNLNNTTISDKIHFIIENLIELHLDNDNINLIQNNKIIILFRIFVSRDQIEYKQDLCGIVLNLCDTYLKEERYCQFHEEIQEIKSHLTKKLQQLV